MRDATVQTSLPPPAGDMVPQHVDELTPLWLTACLRHAGALAGGRVLSFTQRRIGQGKGFAGRLARIELEYEDPLPQSPRCLIAKFASEHDAMASMMTEVGGYEREVRFYRELAEDVGVPTPRCFLAHYDRERKRFLLLLEDMAPAASPGIERGLDLAQAREVMERIAGMHAHWWNRTEGHEWLELDDDTVRTVRDTYLRCLPGFLANMGQQYPTIAKVARETAVMFETDDWIDQVRARPRTLVHNDLHVENIFLPTEEGGRFALIDWQGVSFGRHGVGDVTRILCMGLPPELRRAHTGELLRHYHAKLLQGGVTDYPLSTLKKRFREEMVSMVIIGVLAFDTIDFEDAEGDAAAQIIGQRIEAAVRDSGIARVLGVAMLFTRLMRWLRRLVGMQPVKRV